MKCEVCGEEFEGRRKDARFCSDGCRMKLSRTNKANTEEIIPNKEGESVRDNVTDNVRDKSKEVRDKKVKCEFVLGEKFCRCGERMRAVLHPEGAHEVLFTLGTRYLFSYFDGYEKRGVRVPKEIAEAMR